jgi:hypothetical protein
MRTLSSRLTIAMKVGLPLLWTGVVVAAVIRSRGATADGPTRLIVLVMAVAAAMLIWRVCLRLKRLRVADRTLYVSNYLREIALPLDSVVDIEEHRWLKIRPITLVLRNSGPFGDRIMFMPSTEWLLTPFSPHPMAEELRGMTGRKGG